MKRCLSETTNFFMLFITIISLLLSLSSCSVVTPTVYTITATAGVGGNISPSGNIIVNEGDSYTFTIIPDTCYYAGNLMIDGSPVLPIVSGSIDFIFSDIQENHTIQANFYSTGTGVYNITTGSVYMSIQATIDDAIDEDIIVVCPGTYYENIILHDKNITLQSIDPFNPSTVEATIIRATASDSVIKFSGGDTSTLEGFKITNGNPIYYGGGINILSSSPSILNNIIVNNHAAYGGGIYVSWNSSPVIQKNTITGNEVNNSGGGICVVISSAIIKDNIINGNYAAENGGGIYVAADSNIFPASPRLSGWGAGRENIPEVVMTTLLPIEDSEYTIAGNKFLGNKHGDPLNYTEGAHVYFQ